MDSRTIEIIVTVVISVIASSGFWAFIQYMINRNDTSSKLLLGISHDRIMFLSRQYIERGYITPEEYENLIVYMYDPYIQRGGNGSVKHMIEDKVKQLPMQKHSKKLGSNNDF